MSCPNDGSVMTTIESGPGYTIRRCPWCGSFSEERVEGMPALLQTEWERRDRR